MAEKGKNSREDLRREQLELLKIAAHQLKSPLATIQTSLRTLLEGFADPLSAGQQAILEGAERKTQESLKLVGYVFELVRMRRLSPADFQPVDLKRLVEEVLASFDEQSRARSLAFEVRIPQKLPLVLGYGPGIRLALVNLLDNAFKYTPRDGKVHFSLSYDAGRETLIGKVSDSGIGIPEKDRERIFEEFYRAPNAMKFARSGSGMGMSIVMSAITLHQGTLSLSSGGGQGTTADFEMKLARAAAPAPEKQEEPRLQVVVIGGVAAGPKAAAKARRSDQRASITIVERDEFLSYSGCGLPYYISGKVDDQKDLMTTSVGVYRDPDYFRKLKNITVLNKTEALSINRAKKTVLVRDLASSREFTLPYDKLVLTTGATARIPPVPGVDLENIFTLHRIRDAEGLRAMLKQERAKDGVIIGGGLIGIETAEALTEGGARVTLVEERGQILTMFDPEIAALVEKHMQARGVKVFTGEQLTAFKGEGKVATVVTSARELAVDFVLLATGVCPNVDLARAAGLALGTTGAIRVDRYLRTSDPDIYAGGDCVENIGLVTGQKVYVPLGSTANKHGRIIGINVTGGTETFPGIAATTILKVFDYNVAKAGLSAREAEGLGYRVETCLCPALDKAHYYPGAATIVIKLTVDRATERLLGAQVVGPGDVSKRADIAAALITKGGTVDDLSKLDLSYAPPYSEAIDAIAHAANIVKNKLAGTYRGISPIELKKKLDAGEEILLIDVRTPGEVASENIAGSLHIPLGTLRGRLEELPSGQEIVIVCSSGIRAYEAALILQAEGFGRVRALDGGLLAWPYAKR
jgi:NADPH-dependent 2,4-dienoyl-CoA reductase/sulfur reductase-like enzyme/rhodanese-related sulfurtransferase/two-component sensor histidine kinase